MEFKVKTRIADWVNREIYYEYETHRIIEPRWSNDEFFDLIFNYNNSEN